MHGRCSAGPSIWPGRLVFTATLNISNSDHPSTNAALDRHCGGRCCIWINNILSPLWKETPAAVRFTESWVQPQGQLPESPLEVMSASKIHYVGLGGTPRALTSYRSPYRNWMPRYFAHTKASDGFANPFIQSCSIKTPNESHVDENVCFHPEGVRVH